MSVRLNPDAEAIDPDELDAYLDALNICQPFTREPGTDMLTEYSFEARTTPELGDQGVRIAAIAVIDVEGARPVTYTAVTYSIRVGRVGVTILGQDDLTAPLDVSRLDPDVLDELVAEVVARAEDL